MEDRLREELAELNGEEWFSDANLDAYVQLAMEMVSADIDMDDVIEYLTNAHRIVLNDQS